jgi:inorganic triphosphatase YgiF
MLEVELKFSATGPEPLDLLTSAGELGRARLGEARTYDELDRYLDTRELHLARQQWACRLRTRHGRTIISLKGPLQPGEGGALHIRPELEGPADDLLDPASWPASAALDRLLALSAGHPLVERLALRQRRTVRQVAVGGRPVGELSLDRVAVWHAGREVGRLWCVELESNDPQADLGALGSALAAVDGLRPDPLAKLEHALSLVEPARQGRKASDQPAP